MSKTLVEIVAAVVAAIIQRTLDALTAKWAADRAHADAVLLGRTQQETATYADAARRADEIGRIAARRDDDRAVAERLRDGTF